MGEVDTQRQALNVARMRLLGAEVDPGDAPARARSRTRSTRRCATGSPTSTPPTTCSARSPGPHPFPTMVRDFHRVIGVEAREQVLERTGRLPDAVAACVGGGSNAIGIFHAFLDDADVRLVGFEAGGDGVETGRHGATLTEGSPGALHGALSYLLQDEDGQTIESHSISAGLDYPGVGPEHALLKDIGRAELPAGHRRRGDGRVRAALPHRGHHPGDRVRARARRARCGSGRELGPEAVILVNLSGRGDKDVDTAREVVRAVSERVTQMRRASCSTACASASGPGRAGRLPARRLPDRRRLGRAAVARWSTAGCDLVEVGVPVLRPGDGRPDHPGRRRHRAARRASGCATCSRVVERVAAAGGAGRRHDLLEPGAALRRRRVRPRPRRGGRARA